MDIMGFKKSDKSEYDALKTYKYFDLLDMARDEGCVDRTFETAKEAASFANNMRTAALNRYNRLHRDDGFMIRARRKADRVFIYRSDIDV